MSIDLRDIKIILNGTIIGTIDDKASSFSININVDPIDYVIIKNSINLIVDKFILTLVETLKSRAISEGCTFEAESCLITTLNNFEI